MYLQLLFVGLGGFFGSISRYLVGLGVTRFIISHPIWGTLSVNIIGCLIIGALGGIAESKGLLSDQLKLLLITGFLGGFTTFSSFGFETLQLLHKEQFFMALLYISLSLVLGLTAAASGFKLATVL